MCCRRLIFLMYAMARKPAGSQGGNTSIQTHPIPSIIMHMKKKYVIVLLFLVCMASTFSQQKRDMLAGSITAEQLQQQLVKGTGWVSFPAYTDRSEWEAIPAVYRNRWIADGEKLLNYKWQVVPATAYQEFVTTGNRDTMQNVYGQNTSSLRKLVLAELAEGKGRFIPQLMDGVWALCEMSSWALSAHLNMQKDGAGLPNVEEPIIDLGVGMTGAMMAWIHYFFTPSFDRINPLLSKRIEYEITKRVLEPYYARDDFWWMALQKEHAQVNNWNIWVNFNSMLCMLLIEKDEGKKRDGIYKTMRSADKFINYYKDDGGCEEGPSYWSHAGGMLYNYLQLLYRATGGTVNKFNEPLVRNIGNYICKAYINDRYYINYADAAAKINPDAGLVYSFGKATADTLMKAFGSYLAVQQNWKEQTPGETIESALGNVFMANEIISSKAAKPLMAEFWLPGTEIMGARNKAGTADGFYFSALGGHNAESHNHNDVGSCIVFYNGQPVLIDVGSETYTRQTFGPERYTIWTMQSAYHNLPLVNGVQQKDGAAYKARNAQFTSGNSGVVFSLDIAAAYPGAASVKKWERKYQLLRGKSFSIFDTYELSENKGQNELHFMTSTKVQKIKDGILRLSGNGISVDVKYNPSLLDPAIENIPVKDKRLQAIWPESLNRIVFTIKSTKNTGATSLLLTPAQP